MQPFPISSSFNIPNIILLKNSSVCCVRTKGKNRICALPSASSVLKLPMKEVEFFFWLSGIRNVIDLLCNLIKCTSTATLILPLFSYLKPQEVKKHRKKM